MQWNSSTHPISDLRDWSTAHLLEIRPDFQRREVWSEPARVALIDTIIRNIPMPKLYLHAELRDEKTYRAVIDGQQRITAILDFLLDKITLDATCPAEYAGKTFSRLSGAQKNTILLYKVDVNEIVDASDEEVREIYLRVNKYTKQLTKQELRRADFPGAFLDTSEELATSPLFEEGNVFGSADLRRMGDVEFVSELLCGLLQGIQDKKANLDACYQQYAKWPKQSQAETVARFRAALADIGSIFARSAFPLASKRFRQKADFYSLFFAVEELQREGAKLIPKPSYLRDDLEALDYNTAPKSYMSLLAAYAVRCVSDANSASSRKWRTAVLKAFLAGSYRGVPASGLELQFLVSVHEDAMNGEDMCPAASWECPICGEEDEGFSYDEDTVAWGNGETAFQMTNMVNVHLKCAARASKSDWLVPVPAKLPSPPNWLEGLPSDD